MGAGRSTTSDETWYEWLCVSVCGLLQAKQLIIIDQAVFGVKFDESSQVPPAPGQPPVPLLDFGPGGGRFPLVRACDAMRCTDDNA